MALNAWLSVEAVAVSEETCPVLDEVVTLLDETLLE